MKTQKVNYVVSLFQFHSVAVYSTMKSERGKQPKRVKTSESVQRIDVFKHSFEAPENAKVETGKLVTSLVKHLARNYEGCLAGGKTALKTGSDCFIEVKKNGKTVFDLQEFKNKSIFTNAIRLNGASFKKDKASELSRLEGIVSLIIRDAMESCDYLKDIFKAA